MTETQPKTVIRTLAVAKPFQSPQAVVTMTGIKAKPQSKPVQTAPLPTQEPKQAEAMTPLFDVTALPIMSIAEQIADFIVNNKQGVLQLIAPTGSGKTTGLAHIFQHYVLPKMSHARLYLTNPLVEVTRQLQRTFQNLTGLEIGIKMAGDKGKHIGDGPIIVGSTRTSMAAIDYSGATVVVIDEFDGDEDGSMNLMHNQALRLLEKRQRQGQPLVVILLSATGDTTLAEKFYEGFTFKSIEVSCRLIEPTVKRFDIGSSYAQNFGQILPEALNLVMADIANGELLGKSFLFEVPSPKYFIQMKKYIEDNHKMLLPLIDFVEVWSQSEDAEKALLFAEPVPGRVRFIMATELVRRGATPRIQATAVSGFNIRPYLDPVTGLLGTREVRASENDVWQGLGRVARNEAGTCYFFEDRNRVKHNPSFLSRIEPEGYLLDVINTFDLRSFRWFQSVQEGSIEAALEKLQALKLVEKTATGKPILTPKGDLIRRLPGSVTMRMQTLEAHKRGLLLPFMVISAGLTTGRLLANSRNKPELIEKQSPLLDQESDFLIFLKLWNLIAKGLKDIIPQAEAKMTERYYEEYDRHRQKLSFYLGSNKPWVSRQAEEDLEFFAQELENRLQAGIKSRILDEAERFGKKLAGQYGLIGAELRNFVSAVFDAIERLDGMTFEEGEHKHEFRFELKSLAEEIKIKSKGFKTKLVGLLLSGHPEFLWSVGYKDYIFNNVITGNHLILFPGSTVTSQKYCFGIPLESSGKTYLRYTYQLNLDELVSILLNENLPKSVAQAGEAVYSPDHKCVVNKYFVSYQGVVLANDELPVENHPEANLLFCQWLAEQTLN